MPAVQRNFGYQDYVDDDGNSWSVRGEIGGAFAAVDGHAATYTFPKWGKMTRVRHVRYVVATDPTTFRTVKGIIYTIAAFTAITRGDVIAVSVPGLATTVNYNVSDKVNEKVGRLQAPRVLADHA